MGSCCSGPERFGDVTRPAAGDEPAATGKPARGCDDESDHRVEQVVIPRQVFLMGDSHGDGHPDDGERPVHAVSIEQFRMDATAVTNDQFGRFIAATGYITDAEHFGYSAVFHSFVTGDRADVVGQSSQAPWWLAVRGARWDRPFGRGSSVVDLLDHPVVQVSWRDASAYCEWAGRALPTEAQWEAASRGGRAGERYPWGDRIDRSEQPGWPANIWQGEFPVANSLDDGYAATAPVRAFHRNDYGLWQTVGNVWEWCRDAFSADSYRERARLGVVENPVALPRSETDPRVLRGGSYLCHDSYCNRYRNSARSSNTPDSSMGNAGFRTVGR